MSNSATPTPPRSAAAWMRAGKSEHSATLHAELDFLCAINRLMQGQPHIGPQMGHLTAAEQAEAERARAGGVAAGPVVEGILARRAQEKLSLRNVQRFLAGAFGAGAVSGAPLEQGRRRR